MNRTTGLLIVFEGCDRCGKSTQTQRLLNTLKTTGRQAVAMRFPERSTPLGKTIDQYLKKDIELDDRAAHLLFSANRWELRESMLSQLKAGISIIVDRYVYSGVAYSSAKGLDLEWCKAPDQGLPAPDVLIHLKLDQKEAESRGGFGGERYETSTFQDRVRQQYQQLYNSTISLKPQELDVTGMSIDHVSGIIDRVVEGAWFAPRRSLTETLW